MFQVIMRYPEMGEQLIASISNDLTYNLKSTNCYVIQNKLHAPSYVAEKEVQTSGSVVKIKESEMREYILSHKNEVLDILGVTEKDTKTSNSDTLCPGNPVSPSGSNNCVKFKFDNDTVLFSPTKSVSKNQSKLCNMFNGPESPRRILKKQNNVNSKSFDSCGHSNFDIPTQNVVHQNNYQRSHSLRDTNGDFPPTSKRTNFSQKGKQKSSEMTTMQRFQAKFSSKKSTSEEELPPETLHMNIPEIILNVPEDDFEDGEGLNDKSEETISSKLSLTQEESDQMTTENDNCVLTITMEKV